MDENRELARCSMCKEWLPRSAFNLSRTITRGIDNKCRDCGIAYMKEWRVRNRQHISLYAKQYNQLNSSRKSEWFKEWYLKHREEQKSKALKKRNADIELAREKCREWCEQNKDRRRKYKQDNRLNYRASWQRRRARARAADGRWTKKDIEALFVQQAGRCAYCCDCLGEDFQVDHVIPLARGGSNWPSNLALACPSCNRKKSARLDMKPLMQVSHG